MTPKPKEPNKRPLYDLPDYLRDNGLRVTGIRWPVRMGEGVEFDFVIDDRPTEKDESNDKKFGGTNNYPKRLDGRE